MSVNGFFPNNYVRSDVFTNAKATTSTAETATAEAVLTTAGSRVVPPIARAAGAAAPKLRHHSGRFVKDSRGTHRSKVQQTEWDVGPILPQK